MGRPRSSEKGAQEKMQDSFWVLLEAKPYAQISVSDITRESGLNRSAFYYHYSGIPELADDAIAALYGKAGVAQFVGQMLRSPDDAASLSEYGVHLADTEYQQCIRKLALISGPHGSNGLIRQLKDFIIEIWLSLLGIDADSLAVDQQVTLEFAASGILGVLGKAPTLFDGGQTSWILQSHLPGAIAQLVNSLKHAGATRATGDAKAD